MCKNIIFTRRQPWETEALQVEVVFLQLVCMVDQLEDEAVHDPQVGVMEAFCLLMVMMMMIMMMKMMRMKMMMIIINDDNDDEDDDDDKNDDDDDGDDDDEDNDDDYDDDDGNDDYDALPAGLSHGRPATDRLAPCKMVKIV